MIFGYNMCFDEVFYFLPAFIRLIALSFFIELWIILYDYESEYLNFWCVDIIMYFFGPSIKFTLKFIIFVKKISISLLGEELA